MGATAASQGKVLILDTDTDRVRDLSCRLRYLNYEPIIPPLNAACGNIADDEGIAVVLGDSCDADDSGRAIRQFRQQHPGLPFLCLPSADDVQRRADGGVSWPLEIPLRKSQLTRLLRRAERYQGRERRHRLTGNSHSIRIVRELIEHVADFDTNVMITGQSGTGKELVARTIHDLSDRSDRSFVPINCGAIPAELLESELFGHDKGAFTGAICDRTGRFELAEGGTLFLDEIGDMSLSMQVKLLRVLQEKTFERVGSNKTRQCDVRIIAATHRDLPAAVEAGDFRHDLYYRLNVFPIDMPPLYKRASDLPQLLHELFIQHNGENAGNLRMSAGALRTLAKYRWPGNIRELSNLVERLAILNPEGIIDIADLPEKYRDAADNATTATNEVSCAMQLNNSDLKHQLQSLEQNLIGQAMRAADGVVARAAKLLNMRRTTLVEKIRKYDIH